MQVLLKPGVYSEKKYFSMRSPTENMFHAENECDSDNDINHFITQREKCPNTEFFLVRIFPYSVQIQENTDQEKFLIWIFFLAVSVIHIIVN